MKPNDAGYGGLGDAKSTSSMLNASIDLLFELDVVETYKPSLLWSRIGIEVQILDGVG